MLDKPALHDSDFYAWSLRQAALLRAGQFRLADIALIAEEIETMGKAEKRELVNRLKILLLHLLKWRHQPKKRGKSWETSIRIQRLEVLDHIADNPSLKAHLPEAAASAYRIARLAAAQETRLAEKNFPAECPFDFEQIMDPDFWPAG